MSVPFVIYADFEAITEKVPGCHPKDNIKRHTYCDYGYKAVCFYDEKYTKPVQIFKGENAVNRFLEKTNREEIFQ